MSYKSIFIAALFLFLTLLCRVSCEDYTDEEFCKGFDTYNNYDLHRILERGLANDSQNLYNIQKARFQRKTESRVACLSVGYQLECSSQNCFINNDTASLDCTTNVNRTKIEFLWSSFDTNTALGDILLKYTIYDLRIFGFEWEDDCELYQDAVNINILVDDLPDGPCVSKHELCTALQYITTLLPAYSIAQNISEHVEEVSIGYARSWHRYIQDKKWKTHPYVMSVTIFTLIISKIVIVSLIASYYHDIIEALRWKNSALYFLFWGCHCTVIAYIVVQVIFLIRTQNNIIIPLISLGLSSLLDLIGAFIAPIIIVCKRTRKDLLPVPLSSCMEQTYKPCEEFYRYLMNVIAFFLSFFFVSNLLQIVPNFLIAYYAFPTKSLIHLAFFQVAFVCLVAAFAGTLLLMEKCACLCYIKKTGKLPTELMYFTQEHTVQTNHAMGIQTSETVQVDNSSENEAYLVIESNDGNAKLKHPEKFKFLVIKMMLQIFTALIGTTALILLLITVAIIIFSDTAPKDNFEGILTLLPTIAVDVVIILTRNRVFGNLSGLLSDFVDGDSNRPTHARNNTTLTHPPNSGQQELQLSQNNDTSQQTRIDDMSSQTTGQQGLHDQNGGENISRTTAEVDETTPLMRH